EIGWGDFALERLTPTELNVSVGDSPFARVYGRAGAPVCHLTRGVLQTLASTVLEAPVAVEETACAAVGAERCRFETRADGRADAALLRGVLHIGLVVDDLEQSLREGLRVVPGFPLEGAHGRIAFLEPEPTTGLVTELCQPRGPA